MFKRQSLIHIGRLLIWIMGCLVLRPDIAEIPQASPVRPGTLQRTGQERTALWGSGVATVSIDGDGALSGTVEKAASDTESNQHHGSDPSPLWWILPVCVVVIAAILYWNRTLGRKASVETTDDRRVTRAFATRVDDSEPSLTSTINLIGVMDPQGTLLDLNNLAIELSGASREEVLGKPFWEGPWWRHDRLPETGAGGRRPGCPRRRTGAV